MNKVDYHYHYHFIIMIIIVVVVIGFDHGKKQNRAGGGGLRLLQQILRSFGHELEWGTDRPVIQCISLTVENEDK